ncbi:MAG: bifunctional pyr operon transcriptional regulator/uracil phosphoribosyltransferase PyrR [candidate division WOR-3 bacterium]
MAKLIMSSTEINRALKRIAAGIKKRNQSTENLVLIGIKRRGPTLAQRIARFLTKGKKTIPVGAIDITLYRDDLQRIAESPIVRGSEINFDINDKVVILVDDVLFTGRTVRAALTEILDFGRPESIQLAVLIDRNHRELPIAADYIGKRIKTKKTDLVDIFVKEEDGKEGVFIARRADAISA